MQEFENWRNRSQEALLRLARWVQGTAELCAGLAAARETFLAISAPGGAEEARAERFLEWFLLDLPAGPRRVTPITAWIDAGTPGFEGPEVAGALRRSQLGVFRVTGLETWGLHLEDALLRGRVDLLLPQGCHRAEVGDTLVGRIFPVGEGRWLATDSIELFHGSGLYRAYATETLRLRAEGTLAGTPRLSQLEVEKLLALAAQPALRAVHEIETELAQILAGHPELPGAAELSAALAATEQPGSVLTPFLEALAFHTKLDIGEVQRLGIELWNAHRAARAAEPAPAAARAAVPKTGPGPIDGRRLLAELEAGEARGEAKEVLFARLEAMAGIEDETEDPFGAIPKRIVWRTREIGDLRPLYEEWRWEVGHAGAPPDTEPAALEAWIEALEQAGCDGVAGLRGGRSAEAFRRVFERSGARALAPVARAAAAFARWLEEVQHTPPPEPLRPLAEELCAALERLAGVEQAFAAAGLLADAAGAGRPAALRVTAARAGGWELREADRVLRLPADLPLAVGDLVLARLLPGGRFGRDLRVLPAPLAFEGRPAGTD